MPKKLLEHILMHIPKNEQLIFLLDSIDQLRKVDLKNLSVWLPTTFPSANVKYIISTIPEIEFEQRNNRYSSTA